MVYSFKRVQSRYFDILVNDLTSSGRKLLKIVRSCPFKARKKNCFRNGKSSCFSTKLSEQLMAEITWNRVTSPLKARKKIAWLHHISKSKCSCHESSPQGRKTVLANKQHVLTSSRTLYVSCYSFHRLIEVTKKWLKIGATRLKLRK